MRDKPRDTTINWKYTIFLIISCNYIKWKFCNNKSDFLPCLLTFCCCYKLSSVIAACFLMYSTLSVIVYMYKSSQCTEVHGSAGTRTLVVWIAIHIREPLNQTASPNVREFCSFYNKHFCLHMLAWKVEELNT